MRLLSLDGIAPIVDDLIQIADHHMETTLDCYEQNRGDHAKMISDLRVTLAWVQLQKALLDYKKSQS